MHNKLYEILKTNIKKYYKVLIFTIIMVFLYTYELDYEIYTSGKPLNLNERVEVENASESKGNFYLTYVSARPGIIPFVLLSYVVPSWDLVSLDNSRIENEDVKDILKRGKIDMESVNDYAIKNAFEVADIDYEEKNINFIVYHVFDYANTSLEVGDIIKKVNKIKVKSTNELNEIIRNSKEGETITFDIIRDGKTMQKEGKVINYEGNKIVGLYITTTIEIDPSIDVDFSYKNSESGPSGGLMSTLEIYNKITKKDITKGKNIAGTGTIDYEGNIGEIGGIKYKLEGAVKSKMDVFLAPSGDNYNEAKEIIEKNNYKIKLIEAKTFKQVLEELDKLK